MGADPEVFGAPCGLSSRSITLTKNLEETQLSDCDNPDDLTWLLKDAVSLSMSISGDGVLAQESAEVWFDAVHSADAVNAKIEFVFPTKTITWTGPIQVTQFEVSAEDKKRVTSSISAESAGAMTKVVT